MWRYQGENTFKKRTLMLGTFFTTEYGAIMTFNSDSTRIRSNCNNSFLHVDDASVQIKINKMLKGELRSTVIINHHNHTISSNQS